MTKIFWRIMLEIDLLINHRWSWLCNLSWDHQYLSDEEVANLEEMSMEGYQGWLNGDED